MEQGKTRLAYKAAIAKRDFEKALEIVLSDPITFWKPPSNAPVAIQAIATDPLEPKYMLCEWSVLEKNCKKPKPLCSPFVIRSNQYDHKPDGQTAEELEAWQQKFIDNHKETKNVTEQLGLTLYLLEVKKVTQITDFNGNLLI